MSSSVHHTSSKKSYTYQPFKFHSKTVFSQENGQCWFGGTWCGLDQNSWYNLATWFHRCRCRTEHQQLTELRLNLQSFHSWKIPHYPRWWTKMMFLSQWKAANISVWKLCLTIKWTTTGQNVGNSQENFRKKVRITLKLIQQTTFCIILAILTIFHAVITVHWTTANMDPCYLAWATCSSCSNSHSH